MSTKINTIVAPMSPRTFWASTSPAVKVRLAPSDVSTNHSPDSVTTSWGAAQQCHGLPGAKNCTGTDNAGYVNRTNAAFQKLVTVILRACAASTKVLSSRPVASTTIRAGRMARQRLIAVEIPSGVLIT